MASREDDCGIWSTFLFAKVFHSASPQQRVFLIDINPVFATLFCLIGRRFPSRGDRLSEQSEVPETVPKTKNKNVIWCTERSTAKEFIKNLQVDTNN